MPSEIQPKTINEKLLKGGAISLFFVMVLPSIFILAKVAIGLAMLSLGIIAFKVTLKAMLNTLERSETDKNRTVQNKIINITIGLMSVLIGGLSVLIMVQVGLIPVCAAFTALVLHEYVKFEEKEAARKGKSAKPEEKDGFVDVSKESDLVQNEEKNGCTNEKFDEIAGRIVKCANDFCVSSVERFIPSQDRKV